MEDNEEGVGGETGIQNWKKNTEGGGFHGWVGDKKSQTNV